jgi:hypothetical protein
MFNKALYYPWIDVQNENWLKTTLLYWDKLYTIVPESIKNPYLNTSSQIAEREGFLKPLFVHSHMRELRDIVPEVFNYLETDEGRRVLMYDNQGRSHIHPEKFSYILRDKLGGERVHHEKFHNSLLNSIERELPNARLTNDGWFQTNTAFANFYMTLLANKLTASKGYAVVSDYSLYDQLTLKIRNGETPKSNQNIIKCRQCGLLISGVDLYNFLERGRCPQCGDRLARIPRCRDCRLVIKERELEAIENTGRCPRCNVRISLRELFKRYSLHERHHLFAPDTEAIADGLLAQIILKKVCIKSDIRIDKIIKFREKHQNSLSAFRGALQEFVQVLYASNHYETLEALTERLNSLYINNISPQIDNLRSELESNKISSIMGDFSIAGMASIVGVGSGAVSFPFLGNYSILAGAGISILATRYMYSKRKQRIMRDPLSYVLSIENELGI